LKCRSFLPDYCGINYHSFTQQKLSGKNWRGNPASFSMVEKEKIIEGIEKFTKELKDLK
jgi:hypothetical protein